MRIHARAPRLAPAPSRRPSAAARPGLPASATGLRLLFLLLAPLLAAAPALAAPVTLAWRLAKGATLRYRHTSDQTTLRHAPGAPASPDSDRRSVQRISTTYRLSVLEVDPTTSLPRVLCRYDALAIHFEMDPLGLVDWSSTKTEDLARAEEPSVRPFARLVGQEFSFLLGPDGSVRDVRGLDAVRKAMMQGLEDSAFAKLALEGAFSDEAVCEQLERGFAVLPEKPVEAGATWSKRFEQPIPLLGTLAFDVAERLEKLDERRATIGLDVKLSTAAPPPATDDPIAQKVEVKLVSGSGSGTALWNL
ncbi:MAG TPA: DUF6263 family protein, partial [Planctomycetota bacterium]|nr:DUF6263 family protein [Planctomycetota bacterium]